MSVTTNYGLYIEDDPKAKFMVWREGINKTTSSNMTIIDQVLRKKADPSISVTAKLSASGWVGTDAPYTYELEVDGLGAEQNGKIGVAQSATFEQRQMAREAQLCLIGQEDGKLYIAADGEKPNINIPVTIVLLDTIASSSGPGGGGAAGNACGIDVLADWEIDKENFTGHIRLAEITSIAAADIGCQVLEGYT